MTYLEEANSKLKDLIARTIQEKIEDYGYEVTKKDQARIVAEIADSEDFYQRIDAILEDALHDTMNDLNIEEFPMTREDEDRLDEVFEKGQFILAPDADPRSEPSCYLWEDFKAAQKFAEENSDVHVYTLIEAEGRGYIVPGARWVNRFAYMLAVHDAGIPEDGEVRFW